MLILLTDGVNTAGVARSAQGRRTRTQRTRARPHHRLRRRRHAVGVRLQAADARRAATRSTKPRCARSRTQTGGTLLPRARYRRARRHLCRDRPHGTDPAARQGGAPEARALLRGRWRAAFACALLAFAWPAEARMNMPRLAARTSNALHFLRPQWLWALLRCRCWRGGGACSRRERSVWRDAGRSASAAAPAGNQRRTDAVASAFWFGCIGLRAGGAGAGRTELAAVRAAAVAKPHAAGDRAGPVERHAGRRPAAVATGAGAGQARHAAARTPRRAGRAGGLRRRRVHRGAADRRCGQRRAVPRCTAAGRDAGGRPARRSRHRLVGATARSARTPPAATSC